MSGDEKHPGHQMLVEFIPAKAEFSLGEAITVYLHITNVGDHPYAFIEGGRQRGSRDNQFAFSAEFYDKMLPDIGNPVNFGGLGFPVAVKPGRTKEISIDLTSLVQFSRRPELTT